MEINWSSPSIGYGILIIVIGLMAVMFVGIHKIDQARTRPRHESERHVLVLPRIYLVFVSFLSFVTLPITLYVFVEYFRGRHQITEGGLEYGRVFGSRGRMNWITVQSVRYVQWSKWFRVESHTGEVARVSSFVRDITEFARVVLANVPASAFDEQTAQILQETASGTPPPLYGRWEQKSDTE